MVKQRFITCEACRTNYGTSCTFQNAHEGQFVTIGLNTAEGLSDGAIALQDYTTVSLRSVQVFVGDCGVGLLTTGGFRT